MTDDEFALTLVQPSENRLAVKTRTVDRRQTVKSDPTLDVTYWYIRRHSVELDLDPVARCLRKLSPRRRVARVHGDPAPHVDPNVLYRRWSAEAHGAERTILEADRFYLMLDVDGAKAPEGSTLDLGPNLIAAVDYAREVLLPPALRDVCMVVRPSSSTGFKPERISFHAYVLLERPAPLAMMNRWLTGASRAGFPLDPATSRPGQLFLSGRPLLWGCDDPVPRDLHGFVLDGRRRFLSSINWHEYDEQLAIYEESERRAHLAGAGLGWRAVLERHLGDGEDGLGFFKALSIALGYAARSAEPEAEIIGAMHEIVAAHGDLTDERRARHTQHWLRNELRRLRAKDAGRAARSAAIRRRLLPALSFDP